MSDFSNMNCKIYHDEAEKYKPSVIKILFIVESPPAFKKNSKPAYFYFKEGKGSLFVSIIKGLFPEEYKTHNKPELLKIFQRKRLFLMDAVSYPINEDREQNRISNSIRREYIKKELPALRKNLRKLYRDKYTKIILIKETVYDELYEVLKNKYDILNKEYIRFPCCRGESVFIDEIKSCLR